MRIFTETHRQNISNARKRWMQKRKQILGYIDSPETCRKRSESRLKYLNEHPEVREKLRKFNKNQPPGMKGKHQTKNAKNKIRKITTGCNNPNWKGGISSIATFIHGLSQYRYWRQQVFIKDNFTCQKCGIRSGCGHRVILEAHHITPVSILIQEAKKYMPLLNIHDAC